jgi:hypothetical protein
VGSRQPQGGPGRGGRRQQQHPQQAQAPGDGDQQAMLVNLALLLHGAAAGEGGVGSSGAAAAAAPGGAAGPHPPPSAGRSPSADIGEPQWQQVGADFPDGGPAWPAGGLNMRYKGVTQHRWPDGRPRAKWKARANLEEGRMFLGNFDSPAAAAAAFDLAVLVARGPCAATNFPRESYTRRQLQDAADRLRRPLHDAWQLIDPQHGGWGCGRAAGCCLVGAWGGGVAARTQSVQGAAWSQRSTAPASCTHPHPPGPRAVQA